MTFFIDQLFFSLYNYVDSIINAHKIEKEKKINHKINAIEYCIYISLIIIVNYNYSLINILCYIMSAFLNRQLFFDIILNLKRGLKWDYVTKYPESILDKIEIRIFGFNGRAPTILYIFLYLIILSLNLFI
jgi:hypothetical protein